MIVLYTLHATRRRARAPMSIAGAVKPTKNLMRAIIARQHLPQRHVEQILRHRVVLFTRQAQRLKDVPCEFGAVRRQFLDHGIPFSA